MDFSFGLIQKGEGLNLELKREWVQDKNKFLKMKDTDLYKI